MRSGKLIGLGAESLTFYELIKQVLELYPQVMKFLKFPLRGCDLLVLMECTCRGSNFKVFFLLAVFSAHSDFLHAAISIVKQA